MPDTYLTPISAPDPVQGGHHRGQRLGVDPTVGQIVEVRARIERVPEALAAGLETVLSGALFCQDLAAGCKVQADEYALDDLAARLLAFYEQPG